MALIVAACLAFIVALIVAIILSRKTGVYKKMVPDYAYGTKPTVTPRSHLPYDNARFRGQRLRVKEAETHRQVPMTTSISVQTDPPQPETPKQPNKPASPDNPNDPAPDERKHADTVLPGSVWSSPSEPNPPKTPETPKEPDHVSDPELECTPPESARASPHTRLSGHDEEDDGRPEVLTPTDVHPGILPRDLRFWSNEQKTYPQRDMRFWNM